MDEGKFVIEWIKGIKIIRRYLWVYLEMKFLNIHFPTHKTSTRLHDIRKKENTFYSFSPLPPDASLRLSFSVNGFTPPSSPPSSLHHLLSLLIQRHSTETTHLFQVLATKSTGSSIMETNGQPLYILHRRHLLFQRRGHLPQPWLHSTQRRHTWCGDLPPHHRISSQSISRPHQRHWVTFHCWELWSWAGRFESLRE